MILGTAGHIDHGKSALVEALTGRAMDPFAEERRRGITLDLHFAPLPLDDGAVLGVVDVPGHEDLIRTMAAGAAGMDLALLVIAADEGIMPQTREHLAVLEQLGVPRGIPVVTKADLVEPEWLELVREEVARWLAGSPVRFGPPVAVSARTAVGIGELRARIAVTARESSRPREAADLARLPVDRVLTLQGTGTVVTGTTWSGVFQVGDLVKLLPSGLEGRIRSLEAHGAALMASQPGQRLAVGLAGIERGQVHRGEVLVRGEDGWQATDVLEAAVQLLPTAPQPLGHRARVRLHLGTAEVMARVHARQALTPGTPGVVRLALEAPVVARGGDRFLLRSFSPVEVVGGGWVVDPLPRRGRSLWDPGTPVHTPAERLRALVVREPGGVRIGDLPIRLGVRPEEVEPLAADAGLLSADGAFVAAGRVEEAATDALRRVTAFHKLHAAESGLPLETLRQAMTGFGAAGVAALDRLLALGRLVSAGGLVRDAGFRATAAGGDAALDRLVRAVEAGGLTPPTIPELEAALGLRGAADALRLAARQGRAVPVERDRYFAPAVLAEFAVTLRTIGAAGPITPPLVRDATGLSRKFLIPLLEWADQQGITRREGEARRLLPPR
ncbi:MAG: selenocysteine-specific translation elongation factor [Gemmatimonadetes bacterium]|nr:selenocysteine-specific translation elongation factor [Gemmatimonadota bacterium]MBK9691333.1 selenocysteine-specific translation elongation factor [Gemmatimonadota bacterium]